MNQTVFNPSAKKSYTVQSYTKGAEIDGVELVTLKRFNDDGGSFMELSRLTKGATEHFKNFEARQINYSEMDPGVIKAFHLHRAQADVWFVPPSGKMLVVLVDVRAGSKTENAVMRLVMGDGNARLLRIPAGVAHGVKNIAAASGSIIYFVDQHFNPDPKSCDEGRLPWDFAGAGLWDITKG